MSRCCDKILHAVPNLEELEGEFWRIVEAPDAKIESLYGQDLDSGHHGSGFPLPAWRRELLAAYLRRTNRREVELPEPSTSTERAYAEHPWNVNNMPRADGSVLRYGDRETCLPWLTGWSVSRPGDSCLSFDHSIHSRITGTS